MIEAQTVPAEDLRFTTRMIRDQALVRGWKVWFYYVGSSNMRVQRDDGKILEIFSATPPTTSYAAAHRANDKYFTHIAMQEAGLPVAETYLVRTETEALEKAQLLFDQQLKCVIKPLDAGHGHGITVEISSRSQIPAAFAYAQEYSEAVLIQAHIEKPIDIRVSCINYKHIASLVRIPARVKGDGVHTAAELIDIENARGHRGENYAKELNIISGERAGMYLGEDIHAIPPQGEWVQVLGTANVGTGGETVDVTDDLPDWLIQKAELAAKTLALPVAGVDFLVSAMPHKDMTPEDLDAIVVEVNKCPALFMHDTPTHGKARGATVAYLDYLATL